MLLLRLSPLVPFNLLNYGLGLTGVRFGSYVLASWLGMLPGTAVYVFIGASAGGERPAELGRGWWAFLVASALAATGALGWLAGRALAAIGGMPPGDRRQDGFGMTGTDSRWQTPDSGSRMQNK